MRQAVRLSALVFLVAGCASLSPDRAAFLARAESAPNPWHVSSATAPDVMHRAQVWIAANCRAPLQTVTDYVITTAKPAKGGEYGYTVTRTAGQDSDLVRVVCVTGAITDAASVSAGTYAERNAALLAYYLQTGVEPFPDLVHR